MPLSRFTFQVVQRDARSRVDILYLMHALIEEGIEVHEKLDRLLNAAIARRDNALAQLEQYRNGLGQHLRRVSDEIIDAEFSDAGSDARQEPAAPSIEQVGQ